MPRNPKSVVSHLTEARMFMSEANDVIGPLTDAEPTVWTFEMKLAHKQLAATMATAHATLALIEFLQGESE